MNVLYLYMLYIHVFLPNVLIFVMDKDFGGLKDDAMTDRGITHRVSHQVHLFVDRSAVNCCRCPAVDPTALHVPEGRAAPWGSKKAIRFVQLKDGEK